MLPLLTSLQQKTDTILVPVDMDTKKFLKTYIKVHVLQVVPKPTIKK